MIGGIIWENLGLSSFPTQSWTACTPGFSCPANSVCVCVCFLVFFSQLWACEVDAPLPLGELVKQRFPRLQYGNSVSTPCRGYGHRRRWWTPFKQGVSKQRVMIFAWRLGSQHDVAATRGADSVLASDCRAQFGRPSTFV